MIDPALIRTMVRARVEVLRTPEFASSSAGLLAGLAGVGAGVVLVVGGRVATGQRAGISVVTLARAPGPPKRLITRPSPTEVV